MAGANAVAISAFGATIDSTMPSRLGYQNKDNLSFTDRHVKYK
jgi:hypothetical protein